MKTDWQPHDLIRPCRTITGMSAVLLPYDANGMPDWSGFHHLLDRTVSAGLVPAVDMDTGYANLLDETTYLSVLDRTADRAGGRWLAGAYVDDGPGDPFAPDRYHHRFDQIQGRGGVPVAFQSFGLTALGDDDLLEAYAGFGRACDEFVAFELGTQFAPFGRIYDLDLYEGLLAIDACVGAKHSSLDRALEWERLMLRDRVRPDFQVLTGNDLAIDMVMYGSDYLLGLSAFAPDAFAQRDTWWAVGDARFHQLNDVLQYLGNFSFRAPVPAYKHDAARFLRLRGWIDCAATHPDAPQRPDTDDEVLGEILERLEQELRA